MPSEPIKPNDSYLLGEMNATLRGVADNVTAMRIEVGSLAGRLGVVEKSVTEIEAERSIMIPEYRTFTQKVTDFMATDAAWKAAAEGSAKGVTLTTKGFYALALLAVGILGIVYGHGVHFPLV